MLNEYALRFYALIEQSLRLDALEWRELAMACSLPYMDESQRNQLMANYERASYDIVEANRAEPVDDEASFKQLGELFGG